MQPKTPKDFNASFTNQADSTCVPIKIKTTYIFFKNVNFTAAYNQTKTNNTSITKSLDVIITEIRVGYWIVFI